MAWEVISKQFFRISWAVPPPHEKSIFLALFMGGVTSGLGTSKFLIGKAKWPPDGVQTTRLWHKEIVFLFQEITSVTGGGGGGVRRNNGTG